jgi:hypothetical protein
MEAIARRCFVTQQQIFSANVCLACRSSIQDSNRRASITVSCADHCAREVFAASQRAFEYFGQFLHAWKA